MARDSNPAAQFFGQLVLGALIGAALLTVIGLFIPRTYTSSTVLLFPGARGGGAVGEQPSADMGGSGGSDQPSLPLMQGVLSVPQPGTSPGTAMLILKSRKVTQQLIKDYDLEKAWNRSPERSIEKFHRDFACYLGSSGELRVAFSDREPKRGKQVVESAIKLLSQSVEELSLDPAGRNVRFLQQNLEHAERDCAKAEKALIDFQRSVGGAPPDTQVTSLSGLYGQLQQSLYTAEVEAGAAQAHLKSVSAASERMVRMAQDPGRADNALLASLYKTVVERESELALLREKYTEKRPEVVQARAALTVANNNLKREIDRQVASIRGGASPYVSDAVTAAVGAQARVAGLRRATGEVKNRLQTLPTAQVQYGQLQLTLRDERTRLSLVRTEYIKAQLIAQSRAPQFVTLDPPSLPRRANGLDLYWFTLIGFLGGLLLILGKWTGTWMKSAMKNIGF
ncbi:MAG: GumC family protein [Armatimonadota bacterium]